MRFTIMLVLAGIGLFFVTLAMLLSGLNLYIYRLNVTYEQIVPVYAFLFISVVFWLSAKMLREDY